MSLRSDGIHLTVPPKAADHPHAVGHYQTVAGCGEVEDTLRDDEPNSEEEVTGREKWHHQQHQPKRKNPVPLEENSHFLLVLSSRQ